MGFADDMKESLKYSIKKSEDATQTQNGKNEESGTGTTQLVKIVDIKIPFWSLVWFMVKWVFATIPALIIIYLIWLTIIGMAGTALLRLLR